MNCPLYSFIIFALIDSVLQSYVLPEGHRERKWSGRRSTSRRRVRMPSSRETDHNCETIRRRPGSIVRRLYALLPYFDNSDSNSDFLHALRTTVCDMAKSNDPLHREAAFHTSVLMPVVFMQSYKDEWCLLERFHRSLELFQILEPADEVIALRQLQMMKNINQKVRLFVLDLPGDSTAHAREPSDDIDTIIDDMKEIRYVNELVKNLG